MLDIPKRKEKKDAQTYEIDHKCTVLQPPYYSPSFNSSTCIVRLPLNLCLPFTSIKLKHCPPYKIINNSTNFEQTKHSNVASAQTSRVRHHLKQSQTMEKDFPLSLMYCCGLDPKNFHVGYQRSCSMHLLNDLL